MSAHSDDERELTEVEQQKFDRATRIAEQASLMLIREGQDGGTITAATVLIVHAILTLCAALSPEMVDKFSTALLTEIWNCERDRAQSTD